MRKLLLLVAVVALLTGCCGCTPSPNELEAPVILVAAKKSPYASVVVSDGTGRLHTYTGDFAKAVAESRTVGDVIVPSNKYQ